MGVLLALVASIAFGVGDFDATRAARSHRPIVVALASHLVALLLAVVLAVALGGDVLTGAHLAWAAGAGLTGSAAYVTFVWALGAGTVGLVAPVSAVFSVVVPVLVGVLVGERPSTWAWVGMAAAVVSIPMLTAGGPPSDPTRRHDRRILVGAVGAGIGYGFFYVLLSRTGDGTGMWPVVTARIVAIAAELAVVRTLAVRDPEPSRVGAVGAALRDRRVWVTGVLDASANAALLLALRHGDLSIGTVIVSLYPASTIVLARLVLHEHLHRIQVIGLAAAAIAVTLVAAA